MSYSTTWRWSCPTCTVMAGTCRIQYNQFGIVVSQGHSNASMNICTLQQIHSLFNDVHTDILSLQMGLDMFCWSTFAPEIVYSLFGLSFYPVTLHQLLMMSIDAHTVLVGILFTYLVHSANSSIGSLRPGTLLILGQVSSFQASSNTLQATPIRITFPVPVS